MLCEFSPVGTCLVS